MELQTVESLQAKLDRIRLHYESHIPARELEMFETVFEPTAQRILEVGASAPELRGRPRNTPFRLTGFFLGSYSPFCKAQLEAFISFEDELLQEGVECLFVSPQKVDENQALTRELSLNFPLLSDPGASVAVDHGVDLKLTAGQCRKVAGLGIYLALYHEQDPAVIPVPSLFLTDRNGTVLERWVDRRLWRRTEPKTVLEAVAHWKAKHGST